MKSKGVYVVSEKSTTNERTGAGKHVAIGLQHLNKTFDIELFSLSKPAQSHKKYSDLSSKEQNTISNVRKLTNWLKFLRIYGVVKDCYILITNHWRIISYYRQVKALSPDFIYERSSYLNFNGILIARWLGIPHFYEINGLHYIEVRKYYYSILNGFTRRFHHKAWQRSTHSFIVGYVNERELFHPNYTIIQNGVEESLIKQFKGHQKQVGEKIQMVFIGHLMAHHRIELLISALKNLNVSQHSKLHLIGKHLDEISEQLTPYIECEYHGEVQPGEIPQILRGMHVGLNPGGYIWSSENQQGRFKEPIFCFSPIKIFEYAAAKCLVVAPNLPNLKSNFKESEMLFFKRNSKESLKNRLEEIIERPEMIENYGTAIYNRVKDDFTWERVFDKVGNEIKTHL